MRLQANLTDTIDRIKDKTEAELGVSANTEKQLEEDKDVSSCLLTQLPTEMLMKVFEYLPSWDLCKVAEVSRRMRDIATDPWLWSCRPRDISWQKMKEDGIEFVNIPRFKKIKSLHFEYDDLQPKHVRELFLHLATVKNSIRGLSLLSVNLSEVTDDVLSQAVGGLQEVFLESLDRHITTEQLTDLCRTIRTSRSLVDVGLSGFDLSEVPVDVLSQAVGGLQKVYLGGTDLTTEQITDLCRTVRSSRSLVDVGMYCVDLSEVPVDVLSQAVGGLQKVWLERTDLTTEQITAICRTIRTSKSLVGVTLRGVDLTEVQVKSSLSAAPLGVCACHLQPSNQAKEFFVGFFVVGFFVVGFFVVGSFLARVGTTFSRILRL